jgi:hypothetical protein
MPDRDAQSHQVTSSVAPKRFFNAFRAFVPGIFVILVGFSGTDALAQHPRPEQLREQLDDTLRQLQAAQDRKNELATENEKLLARIAQLENRLNRVESNLGFYLSHYGTWRASNRSAAGRLFDISFSPAETFPFVPAFDRFEDRNWPFSAVSVLESPARAWQSRFPVLLGHAIDESNCALCQMVRQVVVDRQALGLTPDDKPAVPTGRELLTDLPPR